jgi:general secretion pathway protein K
VIMRGCRRAAICNSESGFIIVPVLWILLTLASLAGILSVYLANTAVALSLNDDRLRSAALVSAGLELTAYKLTSAAKPLRPPSGSFFFRLDKARVSVSFRSESTRIDLNLASKEMLTNFFGVLGAEPRDAQLYADRVVGWRTPQSEDTLESENALYRAAGARYFPRGAPFANVQELWLVLYLPPALVERAMQFVTVFSGRHEIDVLAAAPEVVASLPGMSPALLETFLKLRPGLPREIKSIAEALGPDVAGAASIQPSDTVRVRTTIEFDNGRQTSAEAVILLDGGDDPYRILSWRDEVDVAPIRKRAERAL